MAKETYELDIIYIHKGLSFELCFEAKASRSLSEQSFAVVRDGFANLTSPRKSKVSYGSPPHLYRSFSSQELYNEWLFCGK